MTWFKRWSNSSLSTLQVCGEKFRLKYLEKNYRESGPSAKRGIALHAVAKEIHKRQLAIAGKWEGEEPEFKGVISAGNPAAIEEARDLAAGQFEAAWKKGVIIGAGDDKAKIKAEQKDVAVDLAGLYVDEVAPKVVPEAVERKVEIVPADLDITIMGIMDLVESDNGDVIRDLKSKEKKPWKGEAAVSQQLTLYHLIRFIDIRNQTTVHNEDGTVKTPGKGVLPRAGRLVQLVRTPKTKTKKVYIQETTRDLEDIKNLAERIKTAVQAVEKGVFVPADPAAAGSPCSWCEFADGTCKYVRKEKRQLPEEDVEDIGE